MNNQDYRLHKSLPDDFKVTFWGSDCPSIFQEQDVLRVENYRELDYYNYILLQHRGEIKILPLHEFNQNNHTLPDVISGITSFERSCHDDYQPWSGDERYPSKKCVGCEKLQFVLVNGKAVQCCMTNSGLVPATSMLTEEHCSTKRISKNLAKTDL